MSFTLGFCDLFFVLALNIVFSLNSFSFSNFFPPLNKKNLKVDHGPKTSNYYYILLVYLTVAVF